MTSNPQGNPALGHEGQTVLVPVGSLPPVPYAGKRSGEPAPRGGGLDVQGLLRALGRRWLLAVLLGLLLGGAGAVGVWLFLPPPAGTAGALLHMDAVPKNIAFHTEDRSVEFNIFKNTQEALAKSRLVLNAALRNPKVPGTGWYREVQAGGGDHLDWLEKNLKVAFASSPEIMELSITSGKYSEDLPTLVDAITKAYLDEIVEKEANRRRERLEQLRLIAKRFEAKLKEIRASLRSLQEDVGPGDKNILAIRQDTARAEYDQAKAELTRLRAEVRALTLQVEAADKGFSPDAMVTPSHVQDALAKDPLLKQYEERRRKLEELIEVTRTRAELGDNEPVVRKHRAELAKVKEAEAARRTQLAKDLQAQLQEEATKDSQTKQILARQKLVYLGKLEKLLAADAERLGKEAKGFVRKALDLIEFQREVDEKEELLRTIQKQAAALEVEQEAPPRVRQIQDAVLRRPNEQVRKILVSAGTGVALLALALFGVSFFEWRTHRLESTTEVRQLGMNVIGTVPVYYTGSKGDRGAGGYWERRLVDSVDAARTLLLHIAQPGAVKVVMIVSAVSGEGKTSLSSQLGASLARTGRRTLLIDADLRKPAIHGLLGLPESPGLGNVLRGEIPAAEAIQPTPIPNLFLLAAGSRDDVALQALAQDGLGYIFESLRRDYDFILVDSSPVLPVPDALMVARHVDGVLFSIMQRISRLPRVQAAFDRLTMVGARILGAVLNGSRGDESYGYQYPVAPPNGPAR